MEEGRKVMEERRSEWRWLLVRSDCTPGLKGKSKYPIGYADWVMQDGTDCTPGLENGVIRLVDGDVTECIIVLLRVLQQAGRQGGREGGR